MWYLKFVKLFILFFLILVISCKNTNKAKSVDGFFAVTIEKSQWDDSQREVGSVTHKAANNYAYISKNGNMLVINAESNTFNEYTVTFETHPNPYETGFIMIINAEEGGSSYYLGDTINTGFSFVDWDNAAGLPIKTPLSIKFQRLGQSAMSDIFIPKELRNK